jgi:fatty-acyl-CoA synthase
MSTDGVFEAAHEPVFVPHLLLAGLERSKDSPCVYLGERVLTGREVYEQISCYAQAFAKVGLTQGSRIAVLSPNRPEVLFAMGANQVTGCRTSALHPLGSLDDHAYVIDDAEVEYLLVDPSFAERAAALQERVPTLRTVLSFGQMDGGVDVTALAAGFTPGKLTIPPLSPDDVTGLSYTGGTTGKPKGVMGTHRAGVTMTQIQMAEWQWPSEVRHLICTPLSHAGAAFFVPVLLMGGSMVVLPGFEPGKVLKAIEQYKITSIMLVPTMLYVLMDHPDFDKTDLSSLQTIFYGAAAMSPTRLAEGIKKLGPIFFQYYGQAECPMTITVLKKEEHDLDKPERLASCGRPVPWVRVALLDDEGNEVPDGQPGEICVRGTLSSAGYWKKPEQTAELFAHGWLHTGDIARRDDEGFLYIVDRKKDMIISGGFNIYPREVEDVLSSHPGVAAAAVIGVPDEKWGEAVKAVIVRRPGSDVSEAELAALVKERKGAHHSPKSIDFVESIPVSALGKPDKKALRATYWAQAERQVN